MKDQKFRKPKGRMGETTVVEYLTQRGMELIEQNFVKWGGELDLIFWDRNRSEPTIVFVEVKTRFDGYLDASELLSQKQLKTLERTALSWLAYRKYDDVDLRIDLCAVFMESGEAEIEWIKDVLA